MTARGAIIGCVTDRETGAPLGELTFELFRIEGELGGFPPMRDQIDYYNANAKIKKVGPVEEFTTSKDGRLIIEGLPAGTYGLAPKWPRGSTVNYVMVDLDILHSTGDIDVPLVRGGVE